MSFFLLTPTLCDAIADIALDMISGDKTEAILVCGRKWRAQPQVVANGETSSTRVCTRCLLACLYSLL